MNTPAPHPAPTGPESRPDPGPSKARVIGWWVATLVAFGGLVGTFGGYTEGGVQYEKSPIIELGWLVLFVIALPLAISTTRRRDEAEKAAAIAMVPGAQWFVDPTGRNHYRWWDGQTWTDWVCDASNVQSTDPLFAGAAIEDDQ